MEYIPDEEYHITTLRLNLLACVQERWKRFPLRAALMGCILDPRTKSLFFLPLSEAESIKVLLRSEYEGLFGYEVTEVKAEEINPKRAKISFQEYAYADSKKHPDDEVSRYLLEGAIDNAEDPFQWWQQREHSYPHLAILAKKYLSIPASNAPSERVFSQAKRLFDRDRNRVHPDHAEELIMLYYNYHLAQDLCGSEYLLN